MNEQNRIAVTTLAENIREGAYLVDYKIYVHEVSSNSLGDVIVRGCGSNDPYSYPSTSLILEPNLLVQIEKNC
jgi:hypothetical protein